MLWWNLRQLKSEDGAKRAKAIRKLGESRNPKAVKPLIDMLDQNHRWPVVRALGEIGDARAVEPLISMLQGSSVDVREEAASALGEIGDARAVEPLISTLQDSEERVRGATVRALEALEYKPTDETQQAMMFIADNYYFRTIELGTAAVEPLITALRCFGWDERKKAAEALGKIGDVRAIEPLIAALQDSISDVRDEAERALEKIGAQAVEPLIAAIQDSNSDVRNLCLDVLGRVGDRRAVESLIAALQDSDFRVRRRAVKALGRIRDARAVEPLIAALQDSDSVVRCRAAETLGKIGDARAVEPLIAALKRSDQYIAEIGQALGELGDVRGIEPLTMFFRKGQRQVGYDVSLGYDVLPALEKLGWNPSTGEDQDAVRQVEIYRAQLSHRANREMAGARRTADQTGAGSNYWKCPKCGSIVMKPMIAGLRSALSGIIEGRSTCVPCGAAFSAADVYGGKYDVTVDE